MNICHTLLFLCIFGSFFLFLLIIFIIIKGLWHEICGRGGGGGGEEVEYMEAPYWCHAPIFYDGSDVHIGGAGIDGGLPASINYQLIE